MRLVSQGYQLCICIKAHLNYPDKQNLLKPLSLQIFDPARLCGRSSGGLCWGERTGAVCLLCTQWKVSAQAGGGWWGHAGGGWGGGGLVGGQGVAGGNSGWVEFWAKLGMFGRLSLSQNHWSKRPFASSRWGGRAGGWEVDVSLREFFSTGVLSNQQ